MEKHKQIGIVGPKLRETKYGNLHNILLWGKPYWIYSPKVYISELARTEGKAQVYPSFIQKLAYVYKPTDAEFANLNPVAVNTFYQTYLESISEIGTDTEIIL